MNTPFLNPDPNQKNLAVGQSARRTGWRYLFLLFFILAAGSAGTLYVQFRAGSPQQVTQESKTLESGHEAQSHRIGFDTTDELSEWVIHHFKEGAQAKLMRDESNDIIMDVVSSDDASLILTKAPTAISQHPRFKWDWRVLEFPKGKDNKKFGAWHESDYGARVYVVFEGLTDATSETIVYIWDEHFPPGTFTGMPFFPHIKLFVIQNAPAGEWHREVREVYADYETLFGKKPKKNIRAVGMMTDTNDTHTTAHAQYKHLSIVISQSASEENKNEKPSKWKILGWTEGFKTGWAKSAEWVAASGEALLKKLKIKR
ncbi:MAG: hypothetical protein COV74_07105 [Candidatus Omnitrophica bacterium CG11_big_fil_rev_8_21_14_0_20_45_26]|uniref:DUF3047 domain-containing protein n=1 Tax=Candidatus Abzuiibacterium crystallinum TaxID=1974748 RepID=A0A2H0LND7_9BACT|nr:MAG: hypothetical protein COV74_07105 [Candidatus Omnitrophica bacterium CG11_big_fil_rev_8_21_14_0_20_45_26]PIW63452.1 MAG: hypothetical protein COW12_10445 [Candidatus Omnitrophica bacterium CG12_big_fil_rev_8_21_14_0_65_45_16]